MNDPRVDARMYNDEKWNIKQVRENNDLTTRNVSYPF